MSKLIDITGQRFGRWLVLKREIVATKKGTHWFCRCDCGNEKVLNGSSLKNGLSTSCGCFKLENSRINNGTYKDELNNRYGKLLVIAKDIEINNQHRAYWICKCDCGNTVSISSKLLRNGHTSSCGCLLSKGEELISKILRDNNVDFKSQYGIAINQLWYRFDFAIIKDNQILYLIEYDGSQHFYFRETGWNNEENFIKTQQRDNEKNQYCKTNQIPLIRIPYTLLNNLSIEDLQLETTKFLLEA